MALSTQSTLAAIVGNGENTTSTCVGAAGGTVTADAVAYAE